MRANPGIGVVEEREGKAWTAAMAARWSGVRVGESGAENWRVRVVESGEEVVNWEEGLNVGEPFQERDVRERGGAGARVGGGGGVEGRQR